MARLNLTGIAAEVRNKVHNSTLSTAQIALWANIAQDKVIRDIDAPWLEETATFSTTASTRQYVLPLVSFSKIKSVVDETNETELTQISEKYIDSIDPAHSASGSPAAYCNYGLRTFHTQLSAADTVSVVSSSTSDTTQTVLIRGLNSAGTPISETLSLNGTNSVDGSVSFTTLVDVTKSANTEGAITVSSTAGIVTTTHVIIPPDKLSRQYGLINLYPVPSGTNTIRVRYIREVRELVENEDEPDLPEMWHDLVLIGALIQAHEFLYEFEKAAEYRLILDKEIQLLKNSTAGNIRDNQRKVRLSSIKSFRRPKGRLPYPLG